MPSLIAMGCMAFCVFFWLFLASDAGGAVFSQVKGRIPHNLWLGVFSNIFVFTLGYLLSILWGKNTDKNLKDLTVWTME